MTKCIDLYYEAYRKSICPIEVKSSGYKAHASLDAFYKKFPERILHRYLIYTKDYRKDADLQMIPVFLTMFL